MFGLCVPSYDNPLMAESSIRICQALYKKQHSSYKVDNKFIPGQYAMLMILAS